MWRAHDARPAVLPPAWPILRPACLPQERARLAARRLEHPTLHIGNLHRLVVPQLGSSNMHEW